jgi:two-component system, cell cycle sensor histidine kinase and response regulator CckA
LNSDTVNLPRGRGEKVLVVDDEAALREILKATLESYGYEAIVAANGLEALNLAATGGPRIVLTDLNMPGLPGQEVARRIHRTQPDAVFVLMTGVLEPGALDAIEDLAKIILQKPFSTAALLAALRKATELPSSVQAGD